MFKRAILFAALLTSGAQAYTFTVTDTKANEISAGDLLARGMHVYIQWTAQY